MDYLLNNRDKNSVQVAIKVDVLNLIINGLSSKPGMNKLMQGTKDDKIGFKPYYKWTIF